MQPSALSCCFTTGKVAETRDFYQHYFAAAVTFDCGWYVNLRLGGEHATVQFMAPQDGQTPANPAGLTYNFRVADVDGEYARLTAAGLTAVMPLEDHPWGDRGFAVPDPNGILLYIYSDREPAAEFKKFYLQA